MKGVLKIVLAIIIIVVAWKILKGLIGLAIGVALAAGQSPKPGPQVDRQTSCPIGGPTTLKKMAERNYDYRPQWTQTAGEGAQ